MRRLHRRAVGLTRLILVLVLATVVAGGAYGVFLYALPVVTVTEAVEGPVVHAFYATGTVLPQRDYLIKSNLAGILTAVNVDKGDRVKKDQVLAFVSAPDMVFKLRQAEAELEEMKQLADDAASPVLREYDSRQTAADEILKLAQRDRDRLANLIATRASSQADVDRAEERVRTAWSEVESIKAQKAARKLALLRQVQVAQAAVDIAKWNADQQTVRSPIDAAVLDRPLSLGTRVAVNDHLMTVADLSPSNTVMRSNVDEEDVGEVRPGQVVRMTLYSFPSEVFSGKVDKIYDKADPDRRTFEIDVRFDKEDRRLAPGMTGELAFIIAEKDRAVVVPAQSLQNGSLYTVRNGQLRQIEDAEIGLKSVERVEVLKGLSPGGSVVITPVGTMTPGKSVRTSRMDPAAAAGLNKPKVQEHQFKGFNG